MGNALWLISGQAQRACSGTLHSPCPVASTFTYLKPVWLRALGIRRLVLPTYRKKKVRQFDLGPSARAHPLYHSVWQSSASLHRSIGVVKPCEIDPMPCSSCLNLLDLLGVMDMQVGGPCRIHPSPLGLESACRLASGASVDGKGRTLR
jgi:hypothetical protein